MMTRTFLLASAAVVATFATPAFAQSDAPAQAPALWRRYFVGTLSLLAGGLGFWWAWFDRDGLTWHDRASGTRLLREPKR